MKIQEHTKVQTLECVLQHTHILYHIATLYVRMVHTIHVYACMHACIYVVQPHTYVWYGLLYHMHIRPLSCHAHVKLKYCSWLCVHTSI